MGVPVTIAGSDVIVGFDRARLDALARRWGRGTVPPPRLGVAARDAAGGGAEVGRVHPSQPGERAGLQPGDIIESVNDAPVRGVDDLTRAIEALSEGTPYTLDIRRDGRRQRVHVRP